MDDLDCRFEPMDVDRSDSTISKMDISSDLDTSCVVDKEVIDLTDNQENFYKVGRKRDTFSPTLRLRSRNKTVIERRQGASPGEGVSFKIGPKSNIKKKKKNINRTFKEKPAHARCKTIFAGICFCCLIALILFYQVIKLTCADGIDIANVRKAFSENLYGQSIAANKIIEMLNMNTSSKIMFLYGGTGVGKTFAVSLLLENLWSSANTYHYTMPTFADSFSTELMLGLTVCKTSVVVVDGLSMNDIHIKPHIKNVLAKSEYLGKNITVILIYNCENITNNFVRKCDNNFQTELEQQYSDLNGEKGFIKFESLTEEHLKRCIERELGNRKVPKQEMDSILKNFDVSADGCKGVYSRVKL